MGLPHKHLGELLFPYLFWASLEMGTAASACRKLTEKKRPTCWPTAYHKPLPTPQPTRIAPTRLSCRLIVLTQPVVL